MEGETIVTQETVTETPNVASMTTEDLGNLAQATPQIEDTAVVVEDAGTEGKTDTATVVTTETPNPAETPVVAQETVSREDYEKLAKRIEAQEAFFARQGTETGLLRGQTPEQELAELQKIREVYWEDPIKGRELHDTFLRRKAEQTQARQAQAISQKIEGNKARVTQFVPDIETSVADIATLMESDGAEAEDVAIFKRNPYVMEPAALFNLHKRVSLNKENLTLKEQLATAQARIGELEKKPGELITKITNATKTVSGSSGGTAGKVDGSALPTKPIYLMTRDELQALKKTG
jgi:hypothetical protein